MEKRSRRIIALLCGICLWIFYIFQEEMANYGMYTVISYQMHEIASIIPILLMGATIGWFIYILYKMIKKKSDGADKVFIIILLGLVLLQGSYVRQMSKQVTTTTLVVIERIDGENNRIIVQNEDLSLRVKLESPMLVNDMLETDGQKYLVTYVWHEGKPNEGKLQMIQRVE